jgi:hypothetical protein
VSATLRHPQAASGAADTQDPGLQVRGNPSATGIRGAEPGRGPARPLVAGGNVSWSSEEMQRMLHDRPDVKAQAQAIMSSRTLQEADKKTQIKDLLKTLR